jgi:hypothetical protein
MELSAKLANGGVEMGILAGSVTYGPGPPSHRGCSLA